MKIRLLVALISVVMVGCTGAERQSADAAPTVTATAVSTVSATLTMEPTITASPTETIIATTTETATASASPTAIGCKRPPDDYTQIPLYNDVTLNRRTIT